MSAVPKTRLTPEQYLAIERKAEFRSEFYNGEMFAMAGASEPHNRVKDNLVVEIGSRLKGSGCHSYSSDMRVKVSATGLYTYPDIVIVCGKPELEDAHLDTLLNPQVIIEVLSDSTAGYDRGRKYRHYKQIASFREYVLVAQDEPVIERRVRQPDGSWAETDVEGLDREFAFATVPVRVAMADVYAGVTFPEAGGR
ncbi:MAG TPA: Uma2 family endonuclease [Gemmataceae bacterium]|jgi:Uma2 family endonuclease